MTNNEGAERLQVLLVDDEELYLAALSRLLKRLKITSISFSKPKEALRYLEATEVAIDLVITDHRMPDMLGIELARQIHMHHPGLPILLCSGFIQELNADDVLKAGLSGILEKPITANELQEMIRSVLGGELVSRSHAPVN